jgi:hypothetical protein
MGVRFQASTALIELPNPQDDDNDGLEAAIQVHTSITNITRVYKRSRGPHRFVMVFQLSISKAQQLELFLKNYISEWLTFTDYRNENWRCLIVSNPIEFVEHKRHRISVTLDVLGVKI